MKEQRELFFGMTGWTVEGRRKEKEGRQQDEADWPLSAVIDLCQEDLLRAGQPKMPGMSPSSAANAVMPVFPVWSVYLLLHKPFRRPISLLSVVIQTSEFFRPANPGRSDYPDRV
jgi:hypothetical protein